MMQAKYEQAKQNYQDYEHKGLCHEISLTNTNMLCCLGMDDPVEKTVFEVRVQCRHDKT